MPDMVDVLLARALTPQGQIESYARTAQQAVSNANTAVSTANEAITAAETAVETVGQYTDALENLTQTIDNEIDKLLVEMETVSDNDATTNNLQITYPDDSISTINNVIKYYNSVGQNTDGTMTQKAISTALNNLRQEIGSSGGGGGTSNLGQDNAGSLVVIGPDGNITASEVEETELIDALIQTGTYSAKEAVGLSIDYKDRIFTRQQQAEGLLDGSDFDAYAMYGGRKRCNVSDDGTITAFYGQSNYREDGSNGQVMVYQPQFYYQRRPLKTYDNTVGKIVQQETIIISATKQAGFKLHPLFKDINGNELKYVLLSAYEGAYYDSSENQYIANDSNEIDFSEDKLTSIANVKPISGVNKALTVENAERLAKNRGVGWHITNMAAESANQMLFLVEYGSLNGQASLGQGVCNLQAVNNVNYSSQTGSTSSLGNTSGSAESTINITNGTTKTYNTDGSRSISYRGMENPWGNMWRFIGGTNLVYNSSQDGGIPYICTDFNYTPGSIGSNYKSVGFSLPSASTWVSALGYGNDDYDWVLMPAETNNANSALPIGDLIWVSGYNNTMKVVSIGGAASHGNNDGLFYYACDQLINSSSRAQSARLMYIPSATQNNYQSNYNAWRAFVGG